MSSGDEKREDTIKNADLFKIKRNVLKQKKARRQQVRAKKIPKLNRQKIGLMKKHHC